MDVSGICAECREPVAVGDYFYVWYPPPDYRVATYQREPRSLSGLMPPKSGIFHAGCAPDEAYGESTRVACMVAARILVALHALPEHRRA